MFTAGLYLKKQQKTPAVFQLFQLLLFGKQSGHRNALEDAAHRAAFRRDLRLQIPRGKKNVTGTLKRGQTSIQNVTFGRLRSPVFPLASLRQSLLHGWLFQPGRTRGTNPALTRRGCGPARPAPPCPAGEAELRFREVISGFSVCLSTSPLSFLLCRILFPCRTEKRAFH